MQALRNPSFVKQTNVKQTKKTAALSTARARRSGWTVGDSRLPRRTGTRSRGIPPPLGRPWETPGIGQERYRIIPPLIVLFLVSGAHAALLENPIHNSVYDRLAAPRQGAGCTPRLSFLFNLLNGSRAIRCYRAASAALGGSLPPWSTKASGSVTGIFSPLDKSVSSSLVTRLVGRSSLNLP